MTPNWHEYAGKMALYERGWTDTLIREHLPPPEARGGDLCALVGRPPDRGGMNPFWKWKTILKIEPTIADKLASNIPNGYTHAGTSTLKNRGWTEALIREHLPPPEARGAYLFTPPRPFLPGRNPFWKWKTILKVEPTITDKLLPNTLRAEGGDIEQPTKTHKEGEAQYHFRRDLDGVASLALLNYIHGADFADTSTDRKLQSLREDDPNTEYDKVPLDEAVRHELRRRRHKGDIDTELARRGQARFEQALAKAKDPKKQARLQALFDPAAPAAFLKHFEVIRERQGDEDVRLACLRVKVAAREKR